MRNDKRLFWATLVKSSPRYDDWRHILDDDDVPITSPNSVEAQLGPEKVEVYRLDVKRLNPGQRDRLIDFIVVKFNERRSAAADAIDKEGFPIRATDVTVEVSMRAFL